MKTKEMTVTAGKDEFFPTPDSLIEKLLSGLDYNVVFSVLEPSAGKGNLIRGFLADRWKKMRYDGWRLSVDACEIDPYLRSICKYEFSEEHRDEFSQKFTPLNRLSYYSMTEEQREEKKALEEKLWEMEQDKNVHVVHDNFLTYRTAKHYDLILMNPPFSEGDRHLLKALEMQKRGGAIACLLNAETLRNPYTATRQELVKKLQEYNAQVEFVEDAFSNAERKARVDVAVVKVSIPEEVDGSEIWAKMKKAEEQHIPDPELQALVTGDYIEQAIQLYNTEVAATLELYRQYKALVPYMPVSLNGDETYSKNPIVTLRVGDTDFTINSYIKTVRLKYWSALLHNKKFTGKLTSELERRYHSRVEKMADYEFSAFNIKQVALEMTRAMQEGIEEEIIKLFDKLSAEHSWYPECSNNRHYYNGWATNKAHKIGSKVILPTNLNSYSWSKDAFDIYQANAYLSDIEKVLDYLEAKPMSDGYDLYARLNWAHTSGQKRNIELKYFKVDIYKKGTVHIKFLPEAKPIVERLNIYASRKRGWLPPNYGKATYSNMDAKEREVVDSFHGDGSEGSGAEEYAQVMAKRDFYLSEPTRNLPALAAHEEDA